MYPPTFRVRLHRVTQQVRSPDQVGVRFLYNLASCCLRLPRFLAAHDSKRSWLWSGSARESKLTQKCSSVGLQKFRLTGSSGLMRRTTVGETPFLHLLYLSLLSTRVSVCKSTRVTDVRQCVYPLNGFHEGISPLKLL